MCRWEIRSHLWLNVENRNNRMYWSATSPKRLGKKLGKKKNRGLEGVGGRTRGGQGTLQALRSMGGGPFREKTEKKREGRKGLGKGRICGGMKKKLQRRG